MSLVQFEEMYDICCGMMEEEERLINVRPTMERLKIMNDCIPDSDRWWEAAVREILEEKEKESELLYV
jgi:hypothetical protein